MRFLKFDERYVGVRPEDIGLLTGRAVVGWGEDVAVGVEELLEGEGVRAFIPQLAILCEQESGAENVDTGEDGGVVVD